MIFSNITVPLLGLVDTAVIGHLDSPVYLGGVAVGATATSFLFMLLLFLRMSTTGLTAQAYGAKNPQALARTLVQPLLLALGAGALIALLRTPIIEDVDAITRVLLISSVMLVMIVEILNSAIEAVVDRIGSEYHELSGRAKDMGSAAVLIAIIVAVITWCILLWSHFG